MEFEKACNEVCFILKHLNIEDRKRIPDEVIHFFESNQDVFYKVKLDPTKSLGEQELREETKAFLQILKEDYFCEEETVDLKTEKRENNIVDHTNEQENIKKQEIVTYKENRFREIITKIMNIIKKFKKN